MFPTNSVVLGATGMVGSYIVDQLAARGEKPIAVSRHPQPDSTRCTWISMDLRMPPTAWLPACDTIYCAADARLFASALPQLLLRSTRRIVVVSSSSIRSKIDSPEQKERSSIAALAAAEDSIVDICQARGIQWTILRPTMIYREGCDRNVTRLARIIRRLSFMPLCGDGAGLRQPVHAEDLARGMVAAASAKDSANGAYFVTGGDTVSYREMVGRIFDSLGKPRRLLPLPAAVWSAAFTMARPLFPGVTGIMGQRMSTDLVFDSSDAVREFGWSARTFHPNFSQVRC